MKRFALLALLAAVPAQAQGTRCVDARTDLARYYGCLNEDLRRLVPPDSSRQQAPLPYSATSRPNVVGGFTVAGTRQMLGRNFGVSTKPDRLPRTPAPSALFGGR